MAVTMKDVRAALDPEEPNYQDAVKLGADAVPHLAALVSSGDPMLASKATYLASLIKDTKSEDVVRTAAQSDVAAVRVAAAAAAANMTAAGSSAVLLDLVGDSDPGVRKVAAASVPDKPTAKLIKKLDELGDEPASASDVEGGLAGTGQMPGETPAGDQSGGGGTMPGEGSGGMPGEGSGGMPGEQQDMPGR